MKQGAQTIGRGLTCLGLLSTAGYLGWRIATLPSQPPRWLVVLAIVVEIAGFVGSGLLAWALWRTPKAMPTADQTVVDADDSPGRIDVVVRVERQPARDIRATLLSLQTMTGVGRRIVVDLSDRAYVAALADEFDAVYAATASPDRNGLKTAGGTSAALMFLLLDAGDIPTADAIDRLLPMMRAGVAVVIAQSMMADDDSAEHGPNGVHELSFERERLNPALAARGAAILTESGALIRRAAIDSVEVGDEPPIAAYSHWSTALMAHGWKVVVATGDAALVRQVFESQDTVYERRVLRASASRAVVFGPGGIFRWNSLRLGQRMAIAASAVRPLSGLRRAGFIAVVVGSLLTGTLPLRPDVRAFAVLWAPGWVCTALGLWMMSGWTLRPGDRTRWSLRNLGSSFQGLRHPMAFDQRRAPIMTPHVLQHGGALVASVVVLSAVMMMRGLSEQWTHALGAMPDQWLAGLMAVALWSLAMALDVLRMFAKRNQLRRATRVVESIPAEVDGNPVAVFDLTALGAGFEINQELSSGQESLLDATINTARGCEGVTLPVLVRNVRRVSDERWRVGVEFAACPPRAMNPLVEYCMIEPARRRLSRRVAADPTGDEVATDGAFTQPVLDGRRVALRLISLVAVGGAIAAAHPARGSATSWLISVASILIAAAVLAGSVRPRRTSSTFDQSTSSPSADLAIR